ncbi:MAG: GEVED domain-containing protein, partial [Anaerolineae bacterium]
MRAKQILTTAGIIFFSVVTILIVLGAADVGENPISRASVSEGDFDFGDAPADRYSTLQTDDGARHVPGERWLGSPPDLELDGQPHPTALGDDLDGNDDEDGVLFLSPLIPGTTASVSVTASFTGWLNAWLDFHSNDQWADPEDHIFADAELYPGSNNLTFTVPEDAVPGPSFSRWRFSSQTGLSYETGFNEPAPDGEVEDHEVVIGELPAVDSWDKWINGIPWESPGIDITVQTTDTIQVVDVIRLDPSRPFSLTETWNPEHLGWVDYAIEPPMGAQPEVGNGIFTWDVPPGHPEVLVLTKWFHVEPCTWRSTTLVEEL